MAVVSTRTPPVDVVISSHDSHRPSGSTPEGCTSPTLKHSIPLGQFQPL